MRGKYYAKIAITSLNSQRTLTYGTAPAGKIVEVLNIHVGDTSNATNQQLRLVLSKVSSLGTPTGTALTPTKDEIGDQAAASTWVGNVTASEPTYATGPAVERRDRGVPMIGGYNESFGPGECVIAPGDTWGLRLLTTPTSFDAVVEVEFVERG